MMRSADRIVVGTITDVTVNQELTDQNCPIENVDWTLRVQMDVAENLKGEGNRVEFYLGSFQQYGFWRSWPLHYADGQWWPGQDVVWQMSDTLGWSDETGLEPGQKILAFLWDNGGYHPQFMPLGQVADDGSVTFQSKGLPGTCLTLSSEFLSGNLDAIKSNLKNPPIADPKWTEFNGSAWTRSGCTILTDGVPPSSSDAGGD
ncbi:MAG: hypothetical protein R3E66_21410 [bacterium]